VKILIVDEHAVMRAGICLLLEGIGNKIVCEEAADGREALRKVSNNDYDAVLLDLSLPDINGLEVLDGIKRSKPNLPVVILSVHDEEQYAVKAYSLGADGYISKEDAPSILVHALEKVAQGGKYISEHLMDAVLTGLQNIKTKEQTPSKIKALSRRERQIAEMLVAGVSNKEIAWQLSISVKTISTYKTRILNKLNLNNLAELVVYVVAAINSNQWNSYKNRDLDDRQISSCIPSPLRSAILIAPV
jgi:two-component system invasion response regulator UvrY